MIDIWLVLLGLAAVQLHGEESRDDIAALRLALPAGCEVWKAVPVIDRIPVIAETGADRVVLDSASPTQRGGTGERWDWSLLSAHPELDRLVLAGGLNPELARAAEATGVGGLDVNSGVEERPGIKSAVRLADFFRARRGLGRERERTMRMPGYFGEFGGIFVPEILIPALEELEAAFLEAQSDPAFIAALNDLLATYAGRPTPLYRCRNLVPIIASAS